MFVYPKEDGDILVLLPGSLTAWRVDSKHRDYLRRSQWQLYAAPLLLVLAPVMRGLPLALLVAASVAWGSWRFVALLRWLTDHGERVDYKTVPVRGGERQAVVALAIPLLVAAVAIFMAQAK